jgi:hypothetical protein
MPVNVEALVRQCIRFKVTPCLHSSERSAHLLLRALNPEPGTVLQWAQGDEWQLEQHGRIAHAGSFEDCVTELAIRCRVSG